MWGGGFAVCGASACMRVGVHVFMFMHVCVCMLVACVYDACARGEVGMHDVHEYTHPHAHTLALSHPHTPSPALSSLQIPESSKSYTTEPWSPQTLPP